MGGAQGSQMTGREACHLVRREGGQLFASDTFELRHGHGTEYLGFDGGKQVFV